MPTPGGGSPRPLLAHESVATAGQTVQLKAGQAVWPHRGWAAGSPGTDQAGLWLQSSHGPSWPWWALSG